MMTVDVIVLSEFELVDRVVECVAWDSLFYRVEGGLRHNQTVTCGAWPTHQSVTCGPWPTHQNVMRVSWPTHPFIVLMFLR